MNFDWMLIMNNLDAIVYALTIIGLAVGWVWTHIKKSKLARYIPAWLIDWFDGIDESDVRELIAHAATLAVKSDAERVAWVRVRLQKIALDRTGVPMPDSVANALIELVYQRVKGLVKK